MKYPVHHDRLKLHQGDKQQMSEKTFKPTTEENWEIKENSLNDNQCKTNQVSTAVLSREPTSEDDTKKSKKETRNVFEEDGIQTFEEDSDIPISENENESDDSFSESRDENTDN